MTTIISVWLFILHSEYIDTAVTSAFYYISRANFDGISKGIAASSLFRMLFDIVDDFIKDVHRYTNVSIKIESTQITSHSNR